MTEKEISEIRRSLTPEKSCITEVCGCYVNVNGTIISKFRKSMGMMPEEEASKYLAIFKKTLSGQPHKNLTDIAFSTSQVTNGEEYKLISGLKTSRLSNDELLAGFYDKVISCVDIKESYLILLGFNTYDVPFKSKNGDFVNDMSDESFSYTVCSICPVKPAKSTLSYNPEGKDFSSHSGDYVAGMPELGFMFPAFDDRTANIYGALYYTRTAKENYKSFAATVFRSEIPMPAVEQKEIFDDVLEKSFEDKCNISVMRAVQHQVTQIIAEHREKRNEPMPTVTAHDVGDMLRVCGVDESVAGAFEQEFDASFGDNADVAPQNIVDIKKFELRAPDVVIKVKPEHSDLVETRIIDGHKYILIHAEGTVELNGVAIRIE